MEDGDTPHAETEALLAKNEVFASLVSDFPTTLGKETSKAERDSENNREPSLTYGEVGDSHIDFISLGETFQLIQQKYGGLPPNSVFYDLGSVPCTQGSGKGVVAAALLHPFAECRGIELLLGLYYLSLQLKDKYDAGFPALARARPELFPTVPQVAFSHASFFDQDWSDANCFFANSTCFSLAMMAQIADRPVAVGTFAITLTKNLPGKAWEVLESCRKPMSWGEATVFLHRRVQ